MYCGDRNGPVIPRDLSNPLRQLRMYRYRGSRNKWHRITPDENKARSNDEDDVPPSMIQLVSWNVSFDESFCAKRMETTLRHLEQDVFKCRDGEAPEPCVVLLQEVHAMHGLDVLLRDKWVREHFFVTPADVDKWPKNALYGNVTLVEKSIPVVDAHILEFGLSHMQRTGLIVDIALGAPKPRDYDVVLRIINTHLESLPGGNDIRPEQLKLLTKFLKVSHAGLPWLDSLRREQGPGVRGGIIGGDMNPIGPRDAAEPGALGLRDAWGKGDSDERGFTWGEQPRNQFPAARFDKILYLPRRGYRVEEPQRIGVGLKTFTDRVPGGLWTSDHYGLHTKLHLLR
ncbi:Endonuclease/exonuclease/phosphatase [Mycena haematopus]|nr:Endonuclease/exonuclease/phosphatase [Mycena haematopus]